LQGTIAFSFHPLSLERAGRQEQASGFLYVPQHKGSCPGGGANPLAFRVIKHHKQAYDSETQADPVPKISGSHEKG
jgi:hypothetical protein